MDTFNNCMVIDKKLRLPFHLHLEIGNRKQPIGHLISDIKNVMNCVYEIEEYKKLAVVLNSEENDIEIEVIWNKIFGEDEKDFYDVFILNNLNNQKVLYQENANIVYPWRCGTYIFEIRYHSQSYYGAFSITPKNVTKIQLKKIHNLLNEKIQGITKDIMNFNHHGLGEQSIFDKSHFVSFYKWYEKVEKKLFASLDSIQKESESTIIYDYVVENIPKHLDSTSIKWQNSSKGFLFKQSKYLNRKYITSVDTDNNRMVKIKIHELLKRLTEGKNELHLYLSKQKQKIENTLQDLNQIKTEINSISNRNTITYSHKKKMENTYHRLERKLHQYRIEENQLLNLMERVRKSSNRLQAVLEHSFWKSINHHRVKRKTKIHKKSYLLFDHIMQQLNQQSNPAHTEEWIIPAYKPTYLLYEYFVYFVVIESLQYLNFHFPADYDLKEQLKLSLYKDGLDDGTKITLENEERSCLIEVIYNEELEYNSRLAIEKNKHFFSTKFRKKPDIKVDLYKMQDHQKIFQSSFVLEVKYRPLYNIFQEYGSTSTMEQMDDYRGIKYTDDKGKIKFNIVKEVVCIYPGDDYKEVLFNTDYGYFLQLFPDDQEESDLLIGVNELQKLLTEWIDCFCPIPVSK